MNDLERLIIDNFEYVVTNGQKGKKFSPRFLSIDDINNFTAELYGVGLKTFQKFIEKGGKVEELYN